MKIEYLTNRKSLLSFSSEQSQYWDFFISTYNDSQRVTQIFNKFPAKTKRWVVIPEYNYSQNEISDLENPIIIENGACEIDVALKIEESIGTSNLCSSRLCFDMTGFMRPQIMCLVKFLFDKGIRKFDMIYTEPDHYARKENTKFSNEQIESVRQIIGYEGVHDDDVAGDVLVIGAGYDHALISRVINDKDGSRLIQMLSLPSLSADMYQESILRLDIIGNNFNYDMDNRVFFAPANDPFVIAFELSEKLQEIRMRNQITNLYLCPLATKPQALGFSLFYLKELMNTASSIIFPFAKHYDRETSKGVGRTWLYEIRL